MSTWVGLEEQKTELALEWPAEFIHVARLGTRGGQAKKCRGGMTQTAVIFQQQLAVMENQTS